MITNKRKQANIKNSKLGGVKTEIGKQKSKYNALSHGILRQAITEFEKGIYNDLYKDLETEFEPIGLVEILLVEKIAICYLRAFRAVKFEAELIKGELFPYKVSDIRDVREYALRQYRVEEGFLPSLSINAMQNLAQIIMRYDTTNENKLYRALHELERLQRMRKGEVVEAPTILDINANGFVSQKDR